MTKNEMIKKVQKGEPIMVEMYLRNTYYSLGGKRITERQYKILKEHFKGLLCYNHDYSPATIRTTYTLK